MDFPRIIVSILAGWCGNEPRWPWPWPWPGPGPDPDDPIICPKCGFVGSLIGGLLGPVILTQVFPGATGLVDTLAAGFLGGRVFGRVANMVGVSLRKSR